MEATDSSDASPHPQVAFAAPNPKRGAAGLPAGTPHPRKVPLGGLHLPEEDEDDAKPSDAAWKAASAHAAGTPHPRKRAGKALFAEDGDGEDEPDAPPGVQPSGSSGMGLHRKKDSAVAFEDVDDADDDGSPGSDPTWRAASAHAAGTPHPRKRGAKSVFAEDKDTKEEEQEPGAAAAGGGSGHRKKDGSVAFQEPDEEDDSELNPAWKTASAHAGTPHPQKRGAKRFFADDDDEDDGSGGGSPTAASPKTAAAQSGSRADTDPQAGAHDRAPAPAPMAQVERGASNASAADGQAAPKLTLPPRLAAQALQQSMAEQQRGLADQQASDGRSSLERRSSKPPPPVVTEASEQSLDMPAGEPLQQSPSGEWDRYEHDLRALQARWPLLLPCCERLSIHSAPSQRMSCVVAFLIPFAVHPHRVCCRLRSANLESGG